MKTTATDLLDMSLTALGCLRTPQTIDSLAEALGTSTATARRLLRRLEALHLARATKPTRRRRVAGRRPQFYRASVILRRTRHPV